MTYIIDSKFRIARLMAEWYGFFHGKRKKRVRTVTYFKIITVVYRCINISKQLKSPL